MFSIPKIVKNDISQSNIGIYFNYTNQAGSAIIRNNNFDSNNKSISFTFSFTNYYDNFVEIKNNYFSDDVSISIEAKSIYDDISYANTLKSKSISINNNVFNHSNGTAISINSLTFVYGNYIYDVNTGINICGNKNICDSNYLKGPSALRGYTTAINTTYISGESSGSESYYSKENIITNNIIENYVTGICINHSLSSQIINNIIKFFCNEDYTPDRLIYISNSRNCIISQNICTTKHGSESTIGSNTHTINLLSNVTYNMICNNILSKNITNNNSSTNINNTIINNITSPGSGLPG